MRLPSHAALPFVLLLPTIAAAQSEEPPTETVHWDGVGEDGVTLFGGRIELPRRATEDQPVRIAPLTSFGPFGPDPTNRIDIVFVGDGYTAAEMGDYANRVDAIRTAFFQKEPFRTYQNYFTVHRVDVVSNESGVDNDPVPGIDRDTALDMAYWCSGVERLLCVDLSKAYSYANNAPYRDVVIAIANSSKYGGAGYSNLSTVAARNGSTFEVVLHEFGHSFANLADEYFTPGTTWSGSEPFEWNVSTLSSAQMSSAATKWSHWLGQPSPLGTLSTFPGGKYSQFGIYRPTGNSLMRSLGRPFNAPSAERIVIEIYSNVGSIDGHSDDSVAYTGNEILFVTPMVPVGHELSVQWFLDGVAIPGATDPTLDLATLVLTPCNQSVSVTVTDETPFLRSPAYVGIPRRSVEFTLDVPGGPNVVNVCTTSPNTVGSGATLVSTGSTSLDADDLVLSAGSVAPDTFGVLFLGDVEVDLPFGDGHLCVGGEILRVRSVTAAADGFATLAVDAANVSPHGSVGPTDTRVFQYWYRDTTAAGHNLSDAVRVRFCP